MDTSRLDIIYNVYDLGFKYVLYKKIPIEFLFIVNVYVLDFKYFLYKKTLIEYLLKTME